MVRPHLRLSFEDLSLGPQSRQKGRPDNRSGDPDRWFPTFRSGWDLIQGSHLKIRDEDLSLYRKRGGGWELIWGSHLKTWDEDLNPDRKPGRKMIWIHRFGCDDQDETSFEALIWKPQTRISIPDRKAGGCGVEFMMRPHLRLSFEDLRRGSQSRHKTAKENDPDRWLATWRSGWDLIWGSHLKNLRRGPESGQEGRGGRGGDGWGWASCEEDTLLGHKVGVFSGSNFAALCVSSLRQWLLHLYIFARTSRFQF